MTSMKKWLISKVITPTRARRIIACALSWLIYRCMARGTWDALSSIAAWLRKLADFVDNWNSTDLPAEKDGPIAERGAEAVTDEMVGRLVDTVSAVQAEQAGNPRQDMRPGAENWG